MARIAAGRLSAEPTSPEQHDRRRRILRPASRIGAEKPLERVQMYEVAKAAGVAIGTLYRYFPSKVHLFTGVMAAQVDRLASQVTEPPPGTDPVDAVADLLVRASRSLMAQPILSTSMLHAANTAHVATVADTVHIDNTFRDILLRTVGIEEPTAEDIRLVWLLMQCWYGVLQSSLNGRASMADVESDIRLACRLLLAPRSNASR